MSNMGNKKVMSKNLKKYVASSEKTRKELSAIWGVPYTTLCDWINGKKYPRIDKIQTMADYFNIPMSYLIEDTDTIIDKDNIKSDLIFDTDQKLFNFAKQLAELELTDKELEELQKYAEFIVSRR